MRTDEKIWNLIEAGIKRHQNELVATEKKINTEREELLKIREKDFDKLHSKFKVFREKLENNHTSDFIWEEKRLRTFNPSSNHLASCN